MYFDSVLIGDFHLDRVVLNEQIVHRLLNGYVVKLFASADDLYLAFGNGDEAGAYLARHDRFLTLL